MSSIRPADTRSSAVSVAGSTRRARSQRLCTGQRWNREVPRRAALNETIGIQMDEYSAPDSHRTIERFTGQIIRRPNGPRKGHGTQVPHVCDPLVLAR